MDSSAPQSSFQLADTRLVNKTTNNEHSSAVPAQQYDGAITLLRDEDDCAIFAYLKLARSLPQNSYCPPNHACLTRDQVGAIGVLRHCKNSDISAWLYRARKSSKLNEHHTLAESLTLAAGAFGTSTVSFLSCVSEGTEPSACSDAGITGHFYPPANDAAGQQVPTQGPSSQPFPAATTPPSQAKPKYCCTLCSYDRPFKNQSDWKKHEKEHDTTFVCMLKGPREATPHGMQCWFCGILDPPDDHLLTHDAQTCLQGPPNSFSSKRRQKLVNHLNKVHGVKNKSQGEAIAVKWKDTVEKQAWACGFCVVVFTTFNDRLSHIATQHFERGQTIGEWDTTKVIQGLLLQPGMRKAWKDKLTSLLTWEIEDIIWQNDANTSLQHDLEVGPTDEKSAADLAEAAYVACRFNWGMESQQSNAAAEASSTETSIATSLSPNQCQASLASVPDSDTNRFQALSATQAFNVSFTTDPVTHTIDTSNDGSRD